MKKTIAISLLLVFAAATLAFGHAGEIHSYMGTVTTVHTVQTDAGGGYKDSFATTTPGTLTTRASWPGNDTNVPATSPGCVTQVS